MEDDQLTELDTSSKEGLGVKIALAIFAFFLGLVANYISTTFFADKRQGAYFIQEERLVSVASNIPGELNLGDVGHANHISKFTLRVENTGDLPLSDATALFEFNSEARILRTNFVTEPRREVRYVAQPKQKDNEIRITEITLEPKQALTATVYVQSSIPPTSNVFFSGGGGGAQWLQTSDAHDVSLRGNLEKILRYYILALVIPGLISSIPKAVGMFLFGVYSGQQQLAQKYFMIPMSIADLLGSIIRFYFLLRIIVPGYEVIRHFV